MAESATKIRLQLDGGRDVELQLRQIGETGERAMQRIANQNDPVGRALGAVSALTGEMSGRMQAAAGQAGAFGAALTRLGPVGLVAGAALGVFALAVRRGVEEIKEAEEAQNRLEAALRATGNTTGLTARELAAYADRLESTTRATKEEVKDAASVLATFGVVSGDSFTRVLALAQDMAAGFGGSVRDKVQLLATALAAPANAADRLRRSGIVLTEEQSRSIDQFVATGRAAEALAVILKAVEDRVGGQGAAQQKGLSGAIDLVTKKLKDFTVAVAEATGASPALEKLLRMLAAGAGGFADDINGPTDLRDRAIANQRNILKLEKLIKDRPALAPALERELEPLKAERDRIQKLVDAEATAKGAALTGARGADIDRDFQAIVNKYGAIGKVYEDVRRQAELGAMPRDAAERLAAGDAAEKALRAALGEKPGEKPRADGDTVRTIRDMAEGRVALAQAIERQFEAEKFLDDQIARHDKELRGPAEQAQQAREEAETASLNAAFARTAAGKEIVLQVEREIESTRDQAAAAGKATVEYDALARGYVVRSREMEIVQRQQAIMTRNDTISADKARDLAESLVDLEEAMRRTQAATARLAEEQSRTFGAGLRDGIREVRDTVTDTGRQIRNQIVGSFQAGEDAAAQFARTGKLSISDFTNFTIESLARIAYQRAIALGFQGSDALAGILGRGFSAVFGGAPGPQGTPPELGGFAEGTDYAPPGYRWVGERGRELMSFRGGERIIPNDRSMAMARGGVTITINAPIDARGAQPGVEALIDAKIRQSTPQLVSTALAAVEERAGRGGGFAKAVGRR